MKLPPMEDLKKTIPLRCVFCMSISFEVPHEGYIPEHGELLACANCGRLNDYTSLMLVVKERALEEAEAVAHQIVKQTAKELQNAFKRAGFKTR